MKPLLTACLVLAIAGAVHSQARQRPDFSGRWVLNLELTPPGAPSRSGGEGRGAATAPTPLPPGNAAGGGLGPMRVGGAVTQPTRIYYVSPKYPPEAMAAGISGTVILEATIDRHGRVDSLRTLRSVPGLDEAAMDAVSQWMYSPTTLNGVAIPVTMVVTVNFTSDRSAAATPQPFSGRGAAAAADFAIRQDDKTLRITRTIGSISATITYRLDGKESKNRFGTSPREVEHVYVSRWEGDKLLTRITWNGPNGEAERTETMAINGDTLVFESSRPGPAGGVAEPMPIRYYGRKK